MTKPKRNIGKEILNGLRELRRSERGRVTAMPDVAQIRESTGLSQARFAQLACLGNIGDAKMATSLVAQGARDLDRARLLLSERGREIRAEVERCAAAALA